MQPVLAPDTVLAYGIVEQACQPEPQAAHVEFDAEIESLQLFDVNAQCGGDSEQLEDCEDCDLTGLALSLLWEEL